MRDQRGRPATGVGPDRKISIGIPLHPKDIELAEKLASELGITRTELLRSFIVDALHKKS